MRSFYIYYLYIINGERKLSMISDDEWDTYDEFLGKFYYDYDFTFKKINNQYIMIFL